MFITSATFFNGGQLMSKRMKETIEYDLATLMFAVVTLAFWVFLAIF